MLGLSVYFKRTVRWLIVSKLFAEVLCVALNCIIYVIYQVVPHVLKKNLFQKNKNYRLSVIHQQELKWYYLRQLGIDCWVKREPCRDKALQKLAKEVSSCTGCMLPQKRPYTVFSRGNAHATLMIISDVPDDAWVPQEKSLL